MDARRGNPQQHSQAAGETTIIIKKKAVPAEPLAALVVAALQRAGLEAVRTGVAVLDGRRRESYSYLDWRREVRYFLDKRERCGASSTADELKSN